MQFANVGISIFIRQVRAVSDGVVEVLEAVLAGDRVSAELGESDEVFAQ